jgi:tetratricopeptide (TPR) repeat protein
MTRLLFSLLILLSLVACETKHKSEASLQLPELLQRPEAIRYGTEWDDVQNQYAMYSNNIRQQKQVAESCFNLAALFTTEARVTGEHGHYYPAALKLIEQGMVQTGLTEDLRFYGLATKASVLMSQHEFQQALETAQAAIRINGRNAMIYGVLADAYVELGDYPNAINAVDQMVSIRPDLRSYSRVSYLREILGKQEEAIAAMQMAVDAGAPGSEEKAWCQLQLAGLYERKGDLAAAEAICEGILVERPEYPFAIANIGRLMIQRGIQTEGVAMLEKACAIIPEVGFYIDLAKYHKEAGHQAKADSLNQSILAMIDDDIRSGHNMDLEMGHVYAELFDDYPKALAWMQKEYDRRPGNAEVNKALAEVYTLMGDQSKASFHQSKATQATWVDGQMKSSADKYAEVQ